MSLSAGSPSPHSIDSSFSISFGRSSGGNNDQFLHRTQLLHVSQPALIRPGPCHSSPAPSSSTARTPTTGHLTCFALIRPGPCLSSPAPPSSTARIPITGHLTCKQEGDHSQQLRTSTQPSNSLLCIRIGKMSSQADAGTWMPQPPMSYMPLFPKTNLRWGSTCAGIQSSA